MQQRALLDTNILIHRETSSVVRDDIGLLFRWLDRLGYDKCLHPVTIDEIAQHGDDRVKRSFAAKLAAYHVLKAPAALTKEVTALSSAADRTPNDFNDSRVLNELHARRVDLLITEDRGIFRKAVRLGIAHQVFTIDGFLEKVTIENPGLVDYKVLAVKKTPFGNVPLADPFFDSFRQDYPGFDAWFERKSDEDAYVCFEDGRVVAFLYLKTEDTRESYRDIEPPLAPKRRLKIGTFKVELNGRKLGERFLKIVFDNAIRMKVDEVYVTIFPTTADRIRLIQLLADFGFHLHGKKHNANADEQVYVRDMTPRFEAEQPRRTFPYVSRSSRAFLVPIYPEYHTDLLPDSILKTESERDYEDHEPHRNAIRKVYACGSLFRELVRGDTIIFYRTGGLHRGVVTTFGIVERVHVDLRNEEDFVRCCRRRSVFTDEELRQRWHFKPNNRPFVVDFLYAYSFPKRPNMAALIEGGVIRDVGSAPRGFEQISAAQFNAVLRLAEVDPRVVVD